MRNEWRVARNASGVVHELLSADNALRPIILQVKCLFFGQEI